MIIRCSNSVVCFGFFGFEAKTSLYCVINLVTSAFSSHDSLSLIWISESVDLELSSGATLMTISSVGWIKPMEVRDFSVISDGVTLSTVIWNCPLMLGIMRDRVAYRPGILGPIFGSKSPGNKELFVEDLYGKPDKRQIIVLIILAGRKF